MFLKDDTAVNKLFEDFINWRFRDTPEFATCIGINEFDSKLEHYNEEAFTNKKKTCEDFLKKAKELAKDAEGDSLDNLKLFQSDLSSVIQGLKYYRYAAPLNYFEGPQMEILQLLGYMKKETVEDFENIIARYREFSRQADEMIGMMELGIQDKTTSHQSSMIEVLGQLRALQVPYETSAFYEPFLSLPSAISSDTQAELRNKAKVSISEFLLPAFLRLENYIKDSYIPACRPDIAATSMPDGKNYYQTCLKFHLSCDMSPEQVHQLGLDEVDRISKEMLKVIRTLKLNLTIQEFAEQIRNDPQFFYTNKDELLQGYEDMVKNDIMPVLGSHFESIPEAELKINALPESQNAGPAAYYLAGSFDGKRPGVFFVNVGNLKNLPKYEMMSLALHEALPGHHLQLSFMMEMPGVPKFRQFAEDRKYFSVPSRFPIHTAYAEGWGLYSEYLGEELKVYQDPYSLFGRLSQEIVRACRLVVDTGIHAFGWTRERAVNYMVDHSAAAKGTVEKEVNRYIMWPGQACGYKVGEIKIKSLRKLAEDRLGSKFMIKEFHDLFLRSPGPLSFLEEKVHAYLAKFD